MRIVIILRHFRYAKNLGDSDVAPSFSYMLLESLVENLRLIPRVRSAGALHWLFTLLNRIKCMDTAFTGHACVEILGEVAKHYHGRINPLHSLLKSR